MAAKINKPVTKLYRYEDASLVGHGSEPELTLHIFQVIKTTPQGYWFYDDARECKKRWVHNSARKRYAYETRELALNSFIIRKRFHLQHLLRKFKQANYSHNLAVHMQTEQKMGSKLSYDVDADLEFDMEDLEEREKQEYRGISCIL